MFESAELGHKVDKERYKREEPLLREQLLDAQFDLAATKAFPVIIMIGGVDAGGRSETINTLNEWMDPRTVLTNALDAATDEERERPPMWRFWRELPPKGRIGIFFQGWYRDPIVERVYGRTDDADLARSIDEINRFERMLADEGALVLKLWFHLSKDRERARLKKLEKSSKNRWRVGPAEWERFKRYDEFRDVDERLLRQTSTPHAPWVIVEGVDERYRNLTVGQAVRDAIRRRLDDPPAARPVLPAIERPELDDVSVLNQLDLSQALARDEYRHLLNEYQGRLNLLTRHRKFQKHSVVVVFEGNDAAGKGGSIRRATAAVDARLVRVHSIAAPTDEELAHPYLWRFWQRLPRLGHIAIFDRSWYGRVLVERVQELCSESDWRRAYSEINDFEEELARHRVVLAKFWLATSKDEQARRFEARADTEFKRFKLTDEDWRNRERWDDYAEAVCDMVDRTSTEIAPWTLIEANDKRFARVKVLRTLCERLEAALD